MSKRYALGLQPIYLPFAITNNTVTPPVPIDGGALTLTVTKPDGTPLTPYTPTHDGAAGSGLYHQTIPVADLSQLGTYKWKLVVTGAGAGGTYDAFEVSGWRYPQKFRVWSAPVISLTSVVSWDGLTTWDVSQMRASSSGLVRVMAGPLVSGLVDVIYQAGYAAIPERF